MQGKRKGWLVRLADRSEARLLGKIINILYCCLLCLELFSLLFEVVYANKLLMIGELS